MHLVGCASYAELFLTAPDRALSPAEEFRRYQEQDRAPEALETARQAALDIKKEQYQKQAERRLDVARERWGMRGKGPVRYGPSVPVDPSQVVGAVLSQVRPLGRANLQVLAVEAPYLYGEPLSGTI